MSKEEFVLITGASGFLGHWVAQAAVNAGYKICGIDLNQPSRPEVWAGFAQGSCESVNLDELLMNRSLAAVFHLAGAASVPASIQNPFQDFSSLLPGTARLASFIAKHHPESRFVFFSSAAVYGNPAQLPITEDSLVHPISPYGIHKATAEFLLQHYARLLGLNLSILRVFSAYGPLLRKQLLWDLANKALAASANGDDYISLSGTGSETRDFIFAQDVARAALLVASNPSDEFQVFNVGSGIETSINEISMLLIASLGLKLRVVFTGEKRSSDPTNWRSSISRLASIGFSPEVDLPSGILQVAKWIQSIDSV